MSTKTSKPPVKRKPEPEQLTETEFRAQTMRALKVLIKEVGSQTILLEAIISATPAIDVDLVIEQISKRPKGSAPNKSAATKKAREAFSRR